jgi:hypothetical protein
MGNEIEFLYLLSGEGEDRLRVMAVKEHGTIAGFVVQYEALLGGVWRPIVRYDTAHGFAHKDLIHPSGREDKQPLYFPDYSWHSHLPCRISKSRGPGIEEPTRRNSKDE